MLTKLKTFVFGCCVLASVHLHGQQKDSVKVLSEVVVEQSRLGSYAISQYTLPVDSIMRALASAGSLADMLRKFGYGHIRSYGPGGLATASLRGTGSSHTAVLWNGINLVSPLNGTLDLSLVPIGFVDEASIQSGGAASLYGNGSIGGTIQLNNKASFNEGLKLKTFVNGGSFGSYYQDIGVSWGGKKFISSTKVFLSQAKNDFEFSNKNIFPVQTEKRDHSGFNQKGILQQNYWQISSRDLVTAKFWYQDNFYQVPNTTFVTKQSAATEENKYYRSLLGWNRQYKNFDLNYQGAFIHHELTYRDPTINLNSASVFNTFINNVEGNFSFRKGMTLTSGINYTWEQGEVADYGTSIPVRNRVALFGAFKWKPAQGWEISTSVRQELVDGVAKPVSPGITAKVKIRNGIEAYATISRNYRIPTFNDLYWKGVGGLGNPDLKTEISVGGEAGLVLNYPSRVIDRSVANYSLKTTVFSNHVDNWIQWTPISASTYSPQNIKNVWSRGAEVQGTINKQIHNVNLSLFVQYSFTQATNESLYENVNDNELGKQLMFTPIHQASATARAEWKGYYLNVVNSFTGKQFTDSDNSDFFAMQSYNVANVWLSKPVSLQQLKATFSAEINNIFNAEYQMRPGYPMPGRNFKVGLTIQFIKPNLI